MPEPIDISPSEWQVMNVIWDRQPVTASQIIKTLKTDHPWSPATVRTFLHRLVKKGALTYETQGNRYLYRAAVSRTPAVREASKSFLKSVFSGQTGPLLTHFVETSRLTPEEIQTLRDLLDRKEHR